MFTESIRSLRKCHSSKFNIDVYAKDREVNRAERDARKRILTHLILFTEHSESAAGLTLASVVIDIERIGDHAKNIADLARRHKEVLHGACFEESISNIETRVEEFFNNTTNSFPESGKELARGVVQEYKSVSYECEGIIGALIRGESNFNISDAVTLALYLRFLKGVTAHLYNICTSIVKPFSKNRF